MERKIHFDDLASWVSAIEKQVARIKNGEVYLAKVTDSGGNEIDRDFTPLIPQIEDDRVLVLHFEPAPQATNVAD